MLYLKAYTISAPLSASVHPLLKTIRRVCTDIIQIFEVYLLTFQYGGGRLISQSFLPIFFPCFPFLSSVVSLLKVELGNYIAEISINAVFSHFLLIILRFNLLRIARVRNRLFVSLERWEFRLFSYIKCYAAFIQKPGR